MVRIYILLILILSIEMLFFCWIILIWKAFQNVIVRLTKLERQVDYYQMR